MKPSITIDERGVVLHMTDSHGNGVAVPLDSATVLELFEKLATAKAKLLTAEGRKRVVKGLAEMFLALTEATEKKQNDPG